MPGNRLTDGAIAAVREGTRRRQGPRDGAHRAGDPVAGMAAPPQLPRGHWMENTDVASGTDH
jgi:hypothetical protein